MLTAAALPLTPYFPQDLGLTMLAGTQPLRMAMDCCIYNTDGLIFELDSMLVFCMGVKLGL
jgi:hypothetical protein